MHLYIVFSDKFINHLEVGQDLKGIGRGLIAVLTRNFTGGVEKNYERPLSG
jgi:hypothetical protein